MSKVAIVTGGSRGIGAAISIALKDAGFAVAANYAGNAEAAEKFTADTSIKTYKFDVSDYEACAASVKQIQADLGDVSVLVNNAGITRDATMVKTDRDKWKQVIDVNLDSCFNMSHAVFAGMVERGHGRIVNISSINGLAGQRGQVNYSAAKAGVIGFTKALAQEGASKGVTVNAIAPGYIDTEMVRAVPENVLEGIIAKIPVKRLGSVEEIARAVLFLVEDGSGFITGATLDINGGQYMR